MTIFEKMSAITSEISAVAKNLNVGYGRNSYKAVGEADVLAAVKPVEAKNRIYSYPLDREIVESGVVTSIKSDGSELRQQFLRMKVVYRFVDMDDPLSYIDIVTYGDGIDPGDKAPGKAMTYADKYALLKAYKIITGDDPDQYASEPLKGKEATRKGKGDEDLIDEARVNVIINLLAQTGIKQDVFLSMNGLKKLEDMTMKQFDFASEGLRERIRRKAKEKKQ